MIFFIENKILLFVFTAILCIGGVFSYQNLERDEDPGFKIRTATITTKCPNMNADEVDRYVSQTIEDVILEMDEIEHIKVQSYNGLSVIFTDVYENYTDIQPIWDKLRRKVDKIRPNLPAGVSPFVNDEFADVYGTIFSIEGESFSYEELKDFADDIKDELLKLRNIGKVELMGDRKEAVYLTYAQNDALKYKINNSVMKNYLTGANVLGLGGYIEIFDKKGGGENILIEGTSNFKTVEDLKNLPVSFMGQAVKLKDIYEIKKEYIEPPDVICRSNGKNAVLFLVSMKEGGNILKFAEEIKGEIKRLEENYPIGLNFKIQAMQGEYVKKLTDKFILSLFESVIIVIGLVLLILGRQTGLIIGGIIICIILSTFFIMEKAGIGLDKISLSALIISLGILVDNSIVVAEGGIKRAKNGKEPLEAALETAKEFKTALFCASLITSLAFLPIFIAKSSVSEYTSSLFKVVFITLMFSWFYSTTLLPYLVGRFIKPHGLKEGQKFDVVKIFSPLANFSLNNPKKTIAGAGIILGLSFIILGFVPKIFFPDSDRNMFEIRLNLSENANIYQTEEKIAAVENFIKKIPEIRNFSSYIGTSAPRYVLSATPVASRPNFGMVLVNTDDYKVVDDCIKKIDEFLIENFSDVNYVVRKVPLGPPYDAPVEIRFFGIKREKIFEYVYLAEEKLKEISGVYLVKNDWGHKTPRIKVKIDNMKASRLEITPREILSAIYAAYKGDEISNYFEDTTNIPIIFRAKNAFRRQAEGINALEISNGSKTVPFSEVAKTELKFEYPKIFRRDNKTTVTVQGWIDGTTTADSVIRKMIPYLKTLPFEFGYGYEIGGSFERSRKGVASIMREIPTAFGAILIILIWLFNGLKKPFITAICALGAMSGANIGLFLTGSYFGFMTFLGYICLVGIAVNNCVILLETIKEEGDIKEEVKNAVISRITPVFLTATTTIGGMLPLWLGQDPMFSSMAIAIIFGLLSSVLITLLVAPALYLLLKWN